MGLWSYIFNKQLVLVNHDRNENTVECEMMDPKQASTMRSGWALGWLCQKWIPQALVPVVEV